MAGQLCEYTIDAIGNRIATQSGGDSSGANLNAASYTAAVDGRNLYSSRTVPGKLQVMGLAKDYAPSPMTPTATSPRMGVGITPGMLRVAS